VAKPKRSGGLGRDGFFKPTGEAGAGEAAAPTGEAAAVEAGKPLSKADKVRLTVTLYPQTMSALDVLRVELRKGGSRVTYGEVLDEALWALIEKKAAELPALAALKKP